MSNTITLAGTVQAISADIIMDYAYTVGTRTVVHKILNRTNPEITFQPVESATGDLKIFCSSYGAAIAARDLHKNLGTFTWVSTDFPQPFTLNYVVSGDIGVDQDDENKNLWYVTVGYTEVTA